MSTNFMTKNKEAAVLFAMAHIHAGRVFNRAAAAKDAEVVKIVADATKVPPALIELAAPRWTWYADDGMPNVESCLAQGKFWTETMKLVNASVTKDQLFDLSPAVEATARLKKANPFA
jgi:ABC-type nitrate/sulfonate/bicarbonate transport system substrate-binding protein